MLHIISTCYIYENRKWFHSRTCENVAGKFEIRFYYYNFFNDLNFQIIESISPKASVENSSAQWAIFYLFFIIGSHKYGIYAAQNLWLIPFGLCQILPPPPPAPTSNSYCQATNWLLIHSMQLLININTFFIYIPGSAAFPVIHKRLIQSNNICDQDFVDDTVCSIYKKINLVENDNLLQNEINKRTEWEAH